ncbi:hypothetical protein EC2866350_5167 [Escherichia coli 2866350]|nr:hypothetical protein EC2866350_5167 [Escherichia coli 2866350]
MLQKKPYKQNAFILITAENKITEKRFNTGDRWPPGKSYRILATDFAS